MIELKKEFTKKGVHYTQVFNDRVVVVYRLTRFYTEDGYTSRWYEVLRYRTHTPDRYHDDDYEVYGSDEDFGSYCWSCSDERSLDRILRTRFEDRGIITSEKRDEIVHICLGVQP